VSDDSATITITRTAPEDIGLREIFVSLDGESIAILEHGQSVTRTVTPGAHEVRVHNTLFRKHQTVALSPGEHATLMTINRAGRGTYSVLAFLGAGPVYLSLNRIDGSTPR
jgi:hypothetical protein